MSDRMNLDVRVNTTSDLSAIDKALAKLKEFQAVIGKLGSSPTTKALNDDLARTDALAAKAGATFTRSEAANMTALNRRFAFERRMTRQRASEETENARQGRMFDSEAMARLRERMGFQGRMARQQASEERSAARIAAATEKAAMSELRTRLAFQRQRAREEAQQARDLARQQMQAARDVARVQAEASRDAARSAREAAREQAQAIKSQISGFKQLERERSKAMQAAGSSVGRMGGAVRRGVVAGAAGAAIIGAGARKGFDKLTQSGVSIDDSLTQAAIHIYGTQTPREARKSAEELRRKLMPKAVKLGSKTSELMSAYVEASQAGVDADILDKVVGDGARFAKMNKLSLPNTLEESGYALQGLKAFGQVNDAIVGKLFNHQAYLIATTAANREQMSSFTKRGLAAGASVGMNLDDTLAFGAAATAAGAQGSQASRMLSSQGGRIAGWEMHARDITRKRNRTEEDKQFLQAPGLLGFGSFGQMAASFKRDFLGTFATVQEGLKRIADPLKRRSLEKQLFGQEFGSLTDAMVMGSNLRDYRNKLNSSEADSFLDRNWEKQTGSFGFIVEQIKAVFGNLSDSLGLVLKPIWSDLRDWALQTPAAFAGFEETFRVSIRGFLGGLGSSDGTMAGLLRHWFGDPSSFRLNSAAWGDFFRGVGKGLRDVGETIRAFFRVFTGSDSPETIGRWTARILGFSAALVVLSPLLTVVGALTSGILAIASALKVGKAALDLAKGGKPPVAPEGPAAAETGIVGRTLGFLGRMVPAFAMPLTTDASKADNDRLMKRLGDWAKGQKRDERSTWQDPPARVQKQSSSEDWRAYIRPASLESDDLVRGVDKLSRGIDTLNGRLQLAALDGSGVLSASRIARAAGQGTVGSVMSSVGIPYSPGAGGAALYGSTPGSKLPNLGGSGVRGSGSFGGQDNRRRGGGAVSGKGNGKMPRSSDAGSLTELINREARRAGIDPRIMQGIRAGESGHRADYDVKSDRQEDSYGPFQLNRRGGLGARFEKETGLDARDARTIPAQTRWVAELIKKSGPGVLRQWYGYHGPRDADPRWGNSGYVPNSPAGSDVGGSPAVGDAAGQSKRHIDGTVSIEGKSYDFGSGGHGTNSIPFGTYPITPGTIGPWGQAHGALGINNNAIYDKTLGRMREGIEFHAASNANKITAGCIGIAREQYGAFRAHVLKMVREKGHAFLTVGPDGRATITSERPSDIAAKAGETLAGKPGTYSGAQDLGDGIRGKPFQKASNLAKESPAERLAKKAPVQSQGGGAARPGASIAPVFNIHQAGNPEHTANEVQRRLQDVTNYLPQDLPTHV